MKELTLILDILISIVLIYPLGAMVYSIIGILLGKKHYPDAEPYRFAVLVCARNEENVIENLLHSLELQDYPKDLVTIFVTAHNCSDRTSQIAREHGAVVFERNDPRETAKGDALRYGVSQIMQWKDEAFDALCIFDADNLAGRSFLRNINAALHSGADAALGFRNSKNYHKNAVTELFGAYWHQIMYTQNLPNTAMGLPSTIGGTGFAVTMDALGNGWKTETMLEDIEFTVQMVLRGKKIILAPEAVFYDEQPTSWKTGLRQRYRWACGGYQVLRRYLFPMLKAIPKRGMQIIKLLPDILINPIMLLTLICFLLRGTISCLSGGISALTNYVALTMAVVWLSTLPITLMLFLRQKLNPLKNLATLFLFPYFLMLSVPLSLIALFDRNPQWKPIPHSDPTTLETLEK